MKILLTLLLILISFSFSQEPINYENSLVNRNGVFYTNDTNKPYSGKVFSLYDDGKIKTKGTLKDGIMINKTELKWYKIGRKWSEGTFKDGKVDGLFEWWYENGQKSFEGNYEDGIKIGLWTGWYENGQKNYEGTFRDGLQDGLSSSWYENGQKSSERTYKNDEFHGLETHWHMNGHKYRETNYKDGESISEKEWNEDGSLKE